jgi:hypothetical protein
MTMLVTQAGESSVRTALLQGATCHLIQLYPTRRRRAVSTAGASVPVPPPTPVPAQETVDTPAETAKTSS